MLATLPLHAVMVFATLASPDVPYNACDRLESLVAPVDPTRSFVPAQRGQYDVQRASGKPHRGVDIVAAGNAAALEVRAIANGVVVYRQARSSAGEAAGTLLVIEHGKGCYAMYGHMDDRPGNPLQAGEPVTTGERLGTLRARAHDLDSAGLPEPLAASAERAPTAQEIIAAKYRLHFALFEASSGRVGGEPLATSLLDCPIRWRNPERLLIDEFGYELNTR